MKKSLLTFSILSVFIFTQPSAALDLRDQYIVIFKDSKVSSNISRLSRRFGLKANRVYRSALNGFSARIPKNILSNIQNDASVKKVVKDRTLRVSRPIRRPISPSADSTPVAMQTIPTGVLRIGTTFSPTAKINGVDERVDVDVAVIDTGIGKHPDLNRVGGINFVGTQSGLYQDLNGHGTHVAGTIGALDNSTGVVGVAPGARLWAVRVLDARGSGSLSDVIAGIDWVTQNADKIEVANMSLGSPGSSDPEDPMRVAIKNAVAKGVIFVVAAGNESKDASAYAPASFPEVISVSAIGDSDGKAGGQGAATSDGNDDTFAKFSNFGSVVDIAAPGVDIYSTWLLGKFKKLSGTSMASPHVAGVAALRTAAHGRARNAEEVAEVINQLKMSSAAQTSSDGFIGDPDTSHEPLTDASGW